MATRSEIAKAYEGFFFSDKAAAIMRQGNILPQHETSASLLADLMAEIAKVERKFGVRDLELDRFLTDFYDYVRQGQFILGSPLLTNIAAKHPMLASCTAVPVSRRISSEDDLNLAEAYYNLNMGSGYDLTFAVDPCETLIQLNDHAEKVESSGSCERYVGNIAHLSVAHPNVLDFVSIKTHRGDIIHFNISVDLNEDFMRAVATDDTFTALDGTVRSARAVWSAIVESAWTCGDPGIMSLERYNATNPLATHSPYVTTAPCAEVGLAPGEVCVFGYINLAACLVPDSPQLVDFERLGEIAECLTRILDDAVELTIGGSPIPLTSSVLTAKRKIGISICGFADALLWLGIDYGSEVSARLLSDVLATINYRSKIASIRLSQRRGAFGSFSQSAYACDKSFLGRFGDIESRVSSASWRQLTQDVTKHGLRNVMTTALPPSGRSALLLGVNPSIEPYLTLATSDGWVAPVQERIDDGSVVSVDGSIQIRQIAPVWPREARSATSVFRTATEIPIKDHLEILKTAAVLVDDGVSKTINLMPSTTIEEVDSLFTEAWRAGVKAISIYRA